MSQSPPENPSQLSADVSQIIIPELEDRIIVVMGLAGSGKSTFIDVATRRDGHTVGHGMKSHTSDIRAVRVNHPTTGEPVTLVDTPGFNNTYKSDVDILDQTAKWLSSTYEEKVNFATIIFLHRITDNRISGSHLQHVKLFNNLCGMAMPDVVVATTMWSDVNPETGKRREDELNGIWADMLAQECRVERFKDTCESAWLVIGHRRKMLEEQTAKETDEKEKAEGKEMHNTKQSLYIINPQHISAKDHIVLVMGPTRSGKSTFIDVATRRDGHTVGHGLESQTSDIRAVRVDHPMTGEPVVLVDTPGFYDTYKSDVDILEQIARWLSKICEGKLNLATIIYLHSITDSRMSASLQNNLRVFKLLCGQEAMPNVVIVTTMWSDTNRETEIRQEVKLKRIWEDVLAQGCRVERFEKTYHSAWFIIGYRRKMLEEQSAKETYENEKAEGKEMHNAKQSLFSHIRNHLNISAKDRIVVVMGPTGSGKSNFIDIASRQDGHTVGHGLESQTSDIRMVRVNHPTTGDSVVLVDTPGFDDSSKTDAEILTMIADWLVQTYKRKLNLSTIIYLHRIIDIRISASLQKNLQLFQSLCGQEAMPDVVLATTMWRRVWGTEGEEREASLKSVYWADMIAQGCRVERFQDTYESAWHIIGNLEQHMSSDEKEQRAQGVANRVAQFKRGLSRSAKKERVHRFFTKIFAVM